jgi:hypothetical protein
MDFDFIAASDRPALLAVSSEEIARQTELALMELGYKVHGATDHTQFVSNFNQFNYELIIMEEAFSSGAADNISLRMLQQLPMSRRRHATIILLGSAFETLSTLQAFSLSVQCVVNYSEMSLIGQIVQKAIVENNTFLAPYLDVQRTAFLKAH